MYVLTKLSKEISNETKKNIEIVEIILSNVNRKKIELFSSHFRPLQKSLGHIVTRQLLFRAFVLLRPIARLICFLTIYFKS